MTINTDVDLEVEDCVDFLKNANCHVQLVFLIQMARLFWNHTAEFKMQLQNIRDELHDEMGSDTRIFVKKVLEMKKN